ncbi:unnamed protein product [Kuraishia capsulata CBS 1993]|uniref:Copper acquisition factor BIM1-like domain-containing protein n=1 Tax=Kuraishia capsulata CBS 1993 TaxID=1382522 RepID=W6MIL1_9ASCO|nr:uncharacterized protein KUCA_T00002285001 [Kuraishia capsulata CBS 1993]CDK26314.1 unnamed protein product [Kuraishia capsulata CBS 1993]
MDSLRLKNLVKALESFFEKLQLISLSMIASKFLPLLFAATAYAHFRIPFPGERNSTNFPTQSEGPCGGSNFIRQPRFEWNPNGSPIQIYSHHNFVIGGIYFCEGNDCLTTADFVDANAVYDPFHLHKPGNFCIPSLDLDAKTGTNGTIQVALVGSGDSEDEYSWTYNCVDVTISKEGPVFKNQCSNNTVEIVYVDDFPNGDIKNVTDFTLLDEYYEGTVSATGTADPYSTMAMSGMDMSGMDMGSSSTSAMDMDMGSTASSAMDMATSTGSSTSSSSSSSSSSALAPALDISYFPLASLFGFLLFI